MTMDLWMLLAAVALDWLLIVGSATPTLLADPVWALGNRDEPREPSGGWRGRLRRTSQNMNENLPLFSALVIVAHLAGKADPTTALGAQIFVASRVAHAAVYVIGIPYLRTVIWCVSILGMLMIGSVFL